MAGMPRAARTLRRCTLLPLLAAAAAAQALPACPMLSGRYRVAGDAPALTDALQALGLRADAETDVILDSQGKGSVLNLGTAPARQPDAPASGWRTLTRGAEFDCRDGAVLLRKSVPAARQTESGYLEGASALRLAPGAQGALVLDLDFRGHERSTLYSYESARLSVPRPFTGRSLSVRLTWQPAARAAALPAVPAPPRPADPAQRAAERRLDELRARLGPLLGGSMLGVMRGEEFGTRVQLRATRSSDVVATEDRLLASDLVYDVVREPTWYEGAHHSEIFVHHRQSGLPNRPSAFRVGAELDRLMSGAGHVVKAAREGRAYLLRVDLQRGKEAAEVIDGVVRRSTLVGQIVPEGTERDYSSADRLLERWRVTLRR